MIPITQVDAFTDRPFGGNPAAVCLLSGPREADWMQAMAREMNLSATAFLYREGAGFNLRWFTPTVELDLCGHGTLASAHVLWEEKHLREDERAVFSTRSGTLTAARKDGWLELDFPVTPPALATPPAELAHSLDVTPKYVGKSRLDYMIEVESADVVRGLKPDLKLLATIPVRGVIVTAAASPPYDFVSRFFAPAAGIDEDPVTGSAHCCLGPFWGDRLGKNELLAYQASARCGVVRVRLAGDRVRLGGHAVTVLRGQLL